ncbi:MAG TPA: hypothetical protein VG146_23110 [Verrucomicrobiae bacterium]|nr:hypothetical protein [Verrucomicrobiae bacterium]
MLLAHQGGYCPQGVILIAPFSVYDNQQLVPVRMPIYNAGRWPANHHFPGRCPGIALGIALDWYERRRWRRRLWHTRGPTDLRQIEVLTSSASRV